MAHPPRPCTGCQCSVCVACWRYGTLACESLNSYWHTHRVHARGVLEMNSSSRIWQCSVCVACWRYGISHWHTHRVHARAANAQCVSVCVCLCVRASVRPCVCVCVRVCVCVCGSQGSKRDTRCALVRDAIRVLPPRVTAHLIYPSRGAPDLSESQRT